MKPLHHLTLLLIVVVGLTTIATATPISYTESIIATGSLGGVPFTNASVTLTVNGDTSTVLGGGGFFLNLGSTSVDVSGLGTAMFTDAVGAFVNATPFPIGTPPWAGIFDQTLGSAVLVVTENPAFLSYDLTSPIGPITGNAVFNPGWAFPTSLGDFVLQTVSGNTSTFTAGPPNIPEPTSLLLLGTGLAGIGLAAWRRKK